MSAAQPSPAASPATAGPVRRARRPRAPRSEPVFTLAGATEFSDDPRLLDPIWVVQTLKATRPKLYADLVAATTRDYRGGGRRMPGDWAPVYLAFVLSGHVDVQPFYATHLCSPIWRLAGFEYDGDGGADVPGFPSYETVRLRFAEFEDLRFVTAFLAAARELIQLAMNKDPRVGR